MSEVTVSAAQAATKPFIIGKEWLMSRNGSTPGRIVLSNRLPCDIVLKPGSVINRFPNVKRTDADADFTLSITLPVAEADNLIALQKQMKVA